VSVRVHSLTLFALLGACDVAPGCPSWPATLQPPCLGREPKARVATLVPMEISQSNHHFLIIDGHGFHVLLEPIKHA
jgi:hypothetical protein